MDLLIQVASKQHPKEKIAERVIKNPELLIELFNGLGYKSANIKYGCEKVLRIISALKPEILYPYFDRFVGMMNGNVTFHKWGAIIIISNLAGVDTAGKIDEIFKKYFAPVKGPVMITAANIIGNSYKIALAKPSMADKIANEILKIEKAGYETGECVNVAIGHAIDSFMNFFHVVQKKKKITEFVKKQLRNKRPAVKKKAEKFLKKYKLE